MENNEGRSKPSSKQNVKLKYSNETPAVGNSYRGSHSGTISHGCSIWRTFLNWVRVRSRQPGCTHRQPKCEIAKLLRAGCNFYCLHWPQYQINWRWWNAPKTSDKGFWKMKAVSLTWKTSKIIYGKINTRMHTYGQINNNLYSIMRESTPVLQRGYTSHGWVVCKRQQVYKCWHTNWYSLLTCKEHFV